MKTAHPPETGVKGGKRGKKKKGNLTRLIPSSGKKTTRPFKGRSAGIEARSRTQGLHPQQKGTCWWPRHSQGTRPPTQQHPLCESLQSRAHPQSAHPAPWRPPTSTPPDEAASVRLKPFTPSQEQHSRTGLRTTKGMPLSASSASARSFSFKTGSSAWYTCSGAA